MTFGDGQLSRMNASTAVCARLVSVIHLCLGKISVFLSNHIAFWCVGCPPVSICKFVLPLTLTVIINNGVIAYSFLDICFYVFYLTR